MKGISLLQNTPAYKIYCGDAEKNLLSHAYLIVCKDKEYLRDYLKFFAKRVLCENGDACCMCRKCRLVDNENFADMHIYPQDANDKIKVDDIENLIEESYVKPTEGDLKVFIIDASGDFSTICQNKLLKTLEEPPKNVLILIGVVAEFALLPTVLSRVKTLKINEFTNEEIKDVLSLTCKDEEKLQLAIENGDGTIGKAEQLYSDKKLSEIGEFAEDVIYKMNNSSQVLEYSNRAVAYKDDIKEFFSILKLKAHALLKKDNEELMDFGYTLGSVTAIIDKINTAEKKTYYNGNVIMTIDTLLLEILEEKFKWKQVYSFKY